MRVLIACEFSGIVRDAFIQTGHDAVSCDLIESERVGPHIQGDVRALLNDGWDMLIAFPPCTYLARSSARWWGDEERERKTTEALAFVLDLWNAPIERVAIENPIGRLNQLWRYPDQIIQPSHFGAPYRKSTCLWLRKLPPLMASLIVADPVCFMNSNTGNRHSDSRERIRGPARNWKDRSRTSQGVAQAMSAQWGG
jgi:hypothetical protein